MFLIPTAAEKIEEKEENQDIRKREEGSVKGVAKGKRKVNNRIS